MNGLRVIITDDFKAPEQWSFWKKLGIYLLSPFRKCRCGRGRHFHWPKSPADALAEAARKMADALREAEDRRLEAELDQCLGCQHAPHPGRQCAAVVGCCSNEDCDLVVACECGRHK